MTATSMQLDVIDLAKCADLAKWLRAGQRLVVAGQERIDELEAAVDEFKTMEFIRSSTPQQ